ncbi:hypothetical protein JZ751_017670 [Albula glossodonta]|uniref:Uncharacterized protein n=1 Tax=Albula glossodonta TaxID=121402 RepID=A0A8T2PKG9_9TELE|nr:hypothetical protein JZ751_017670 [Albula glossodonta]
MHSKGRVPQNLLHRDMTSERRSQSAVSGIPSHHLVYRGSYPERPPQHKASGVKCRAQHQNLGMWGKDDDNGTMTEGAES